MKSYFELAKRHIDSDTYSWRLFDPFYEKLDVFVENFDRFMEMADREIMLDVILNLIIKTIETDTISLAYLSSYEETLEQLLEQQYDEFLSLAPDSSAYYGRKNNVMDLTKILYSMNGTNSVDKLRKLLRSKDNYVRMYALIGLIAKNEAVNEKLLREHANNDFLNYDFIREVKRIKKLERLNGFINQELVARSNIMNYFYYDDYIPSKIEFVKAINTELEEDTVKVLIFKYRYKGQRGWHTAYSGPQPVNETEIILDDERTAAYLGNFNDDSMDDIEKKVLNSFRSYSD